MQTIDEKHVSGRDGKFTRYTKESSDIILETDISDPPLTVKRRFSFCKDARTLRIQTSLRARYKPVTVKQIDLLAIIISGEELHLTGPDYVSFPIFGERIFAGIEHPSAECHVQDSTLS
jgi:hypothetical protein